MEHSDMERVLEMKEYLKETEEKLLKERLKWMEFPCLNEETRAVCDIQNALLGLALKRTGGSLVIAYLRSSYITESHEFYFAFYSGEPFVEEEPDCIYYSLSPFFKGIEEEMEILYKLLKSTYTRILASEKEEIRRWHIHSIYMNLRQLFDSVLKPVRDKFEENIYYGSYMEKLEPLFKN